MIHSFLNFSCDGFIPKPCGSGLCVVESNGVKRSPSHATIRIHGITRSSRKRKEILCYFLPRTAVRLNFMGEEGSVCVQNPALLWDAPTATGFILLLPCTEPSSCSSSSACHAGELLQTPVQE